MLGSFRKFKSSFLAKIFLVLVAVPFIFWGMGPVFQGTKLSSIVTIGDNKITGDEFAQYLKKISENNNITFNDNDIEKLLSKYIGDKLIKYEMDELNFKISDSSLAKIIKNEKIFQKQNIFSRTRYEKFLIENNITAAIFENNILNQEKKNQFFEFVGGGILPTQFQVNINYEIANQKRYIKIIDLNNISKENINFTKEQIRNFYNQNKTNYNQIYKTIKFINLSPKKLTGEDNFNSLFFEKIDEIDDLIVEGLDLNSLTKKYNLDGEYILTYNSERLNKNLKKTNKIEKDLINNIFTQDDAESIFIFQRDDDYILAEIINTENIQKSIDDLAVQKDIKDKLSVENKRKLIAELINKINSNKFNKVNFDEFSKNKKITAKEIKINNINDSKILKETIVKQIYKHPSKKVILAGSKNLEEIFLVYINKVENVSLNKNSEKLDKYLVKSKASLVNSLYDTYDLYLKNKYPIEINYNVLDNIKDYFK